MPRPKLSLTDLLQEHALDSKQSIKQMQQELRNDGVDIDRILKRVQNEVGARIRQHYATLAQKQSGEDLLAAAIAFFSTQPITEVRRWLLAVARGEAGPDAQVVAQPCFRNKSPEEMTEAELRNLAAEIRATIGGRDSGKSI